MKNFRISPNGYNQKEVNDFLDMVISRMEKVLQENNELKKEMRQLKNSPNMAVSEEKLNKAILAVQETSDRMKELARTESTMIIEDAKRNANSIIHEALVNAEKTEYEANLLRKNLNVYKNRIKNILQSQLELSDDLDKIEL